jgi:hypothetical protein
VKKIVFFFEPPWLSSWLFLRLLFFKKFFQAFLRTKIIVFPFDSLPKGGSLRNIGLARRVLNKFFRPRLRGLFFSPHEHVANKVTKNRVKKEKEKDEEKQTEHNQLSLVENSRFQISNSKI